MQDQQHGTCQGKTLRDSGVDEDFPQRIPATQGIIPRTDRGLQEVTRLHSSGNKHMRSPMKGGLCDVFDRGLIPRKQKELKKI